MGLRTNAEVASLVGAKVQALARVILDNERESGYWRTDSGNAMVVVAFGGAAKRLRDLMELDPDEIESEEVDLTGDPDDGDKDDDAPSN